MSGRWSREILIPRESGGGPVHAPCLMRRAPNPGGDDTTLQIIKDMYSILAFKPVLQYTQVQPTSTSIRSLMRLELDIQYHSRTCSFTASHKQLARVSPQENAQNHKHQDRVEDIQHVFVR